MPPAWPAKARHWEFLRPHFERLRGRLRTHHDARFPYSHAVRVGIDARDWWISVALDGLAPAQVARVREALLLVGAFAQLQRACCLQYLQTFSLWHPAAFVDLEDTRFVPRLRVDVAPLARGPRGPDAAAFRALVGSGEDETAMSAGFVGDWARVMDMQDRVGGATVDLAPVELWIQVNASGVAAEQQPTYFQCVAQAIQDAEAALRERSFVPHGERVQLEPAFVVVAMDLALERASMSLATLEELRRLVALRVPLQNVELPVVAVLSLDDALWRFAWCELLCSLLGVSSDGAPSIRRLIVPSEFVRGPLLSSMFSALVFSRGVGELQLGRLVTGPPSREAGARRGQDDEASVLGAVDPNFWYWLACLLLPSSISSPRPIETVSLIGARITEASMSSIESAAQSKQPAIRRVTQALVPGIHLDRSSLTSHLETVSINAGTTLTLHEINDTNEITTTTQLTGKIVHVGIGTSPTVLVVPGVGVCSTAHSTLPVHRADTTNDAAAQLVPVNLKNLKFIAPPSGSQSLAVLKRLIRLVGPALEGLHVSTQRMTGATVASFLRACPNLESLSITGAYIMSLQFLLDAYGRGCKVSSLEFATDPSVRAAHAWDIEPRVTLEFPAMDSLFVELLSDQNPIARTLTRLSLVRCDLHHGQCRMMNDVLAINHTLTHFWYLGCHSPAFSGQWIHERHHGELLRDTSSIPLDHSQRLAFLSVLRHHRQGNAAFHIDSFVGSSIFQFAATRQRRSVVRSFY